MSVTIDRFYNVALNSPVGPWILKIRWVLRYLVVMQDVARQREALGRLTERDLRDIGASPADVRRELEKSSFSIPECQKWRLDCC